MVENNLAIVTCTTPLIAATEYKLLSVVIYFTHVTMFSFETNQHSLFTLSTVTDTDAEDT